jgi:hypothetical protein
MNQKGNVCGIVGICTGWLVPIAGIILGIVALSRKEDAPALGIIAILESVIFWGLYTAVIVGSH